MAHHTLIGKRAPSISLPNSNGETFTLMPGEGIPIALFFYPKSRSYGCTKEACQFRDAIAEKEIFKSTKAQIVGVSPDTVDKQALFVEKQKLTYPVLSDEKGDGRKTYGVGKGMFGLLDSRVTFIIDGKGVVRDVLDANINYGAHSKFASSWLDKLEAEQAALVPVPTLTDAPAAEPGQDATAP